MKRGILFVENIPDGKKNLLTRLAGMYVIHQLNCAAVDASKLNTFLSSFSEEEKKQSVICLQNFELFPKNLYNVLIHLIEFDYFNIVMMTDQNSINSVLSPNSIPLHLKSKCFMCSEINIVVKFLKYQIKINN